MKIIQHKDGIVVATYVARDDADNANVIVVDNIPPYEPKEGYNGLLCYDIVKGVYWEYIKVD